MYSAARTQLKVDDASKRLGFRLERHSHAACQRARTYFEELAVVERNDAGLVKHVRLRRPLRKDEKKWIQNERALCALDFRYWDSRYAYIRGYDGQLIVAQPNIGQRILIDLWAEMEEEYRAIAVQVNKARQLGLSTITEKAVAHRVQFVPSTAAIVGSADEDKSYLMSQMMERCWANQPWFLLPFVTDYNKGDYIGFKGTGSSVSIQHGSQRGGIGRGYTPNVAHLSELCEYQRPQDLVDAALLKAMHESPWMFLVLESTAMGRHNWWHETWLYNKENWEDRTARLRPVFLPWYVGSDIYPTPGWIRAHPIRSGWEPDQLTVSHANRARNYVRSSDILRRYMGDDWEMPLEQMWWWEVNRKEYARKGELAQFYSECPADDEECFQSTAVSVFDLDLIADYRERTSKLPLGVFGLEGPDVMPHLLPAKRDIDLDMPPIDIRGRYRLVPLKWRRRISPNSELGKIFIWELPENNEEYGFGVDMSDGVGLDRTVVEIMRKGTIDRNDAQVLEFASPYINSHELPPFCHALGLLYSTWKGDRLQQPKMVIECNGNGETTQLELRKMGWSNFHQWLRYDSKKLNSSRASKLGWYTTGWSRPLVVDWLTFYIRAERMEINSPWFVSEMSDFERDEDAQVAKAAKGGHDDRLMALGIVLVSLHALELRGTQKSLVYERLRKTREKDDYPIYHPGWQGSDVSPESPFEGNIRRYQDEQLPTMW